MVFKIEVDLGNTGQLNLFGLQLQPTAIKVMQRAFSQALPVVKSNERIRTGNMVSKTNQNPTAAGAILIAEAPYSGYQNFGTKFMSGTHFMEAGLEVIGSAITDNLATELSRIT
jgi:hypothetical protein